jgi:hypothetical protein
MRISRVPTWLPPNAAADLVPADSPITPASAINNTASTPPGVPDRYAHLLKQGVVRDPAPDAQHGRRCVKHLTILTVRRHPLSTFPAIGIAAYPPTKIGGVLATGYLPIPACADYPAGSHRPLAPHIRRLASGEQTAAA